jgi:hypothetical protein
MNSYVVICRLGKTERNPDDTAYTLATRQTFGTKAQARAYAKTVAKCRRPIVVCGRWGELRVDMRCKNQMVYGQS